MRRPQSPIEIQLRDAIAAEIRRRGIGLIDLTFDEPFVADDGCVEMFELSAQEPIGRYAIDLFLNDQREGLLAIECDGFDFHGRTAQQATHDRRRDRIVLAHGIQTIRFTGSEIFRDANACAVAALDLFDAIRIRDERAARALINDERAAAWRRMEVH